MHSLPILSLAIWLPIIVGILVLAVGSDSNPGPTRWIALIGSVAGLLVTIPLKASVWDETEPATIVEVAAWNEPSVPTVKLAMKPASRLAKKCCTACC